MLNTWEQRADRSVKAPLHMYLPGLSSPIGRISWASHGEDYGLV